MHGFPTHSEHETRSTPAPAGPAFIGFPAWKTPGWVAFRRCRFRSACCWNRVLRNCDGYEVTEEDVKNLAAWNAATPAQVEIPFKPARVVLQDFTGVPCVVDLAAMRSAMKRLGGDPKKINPLVPVDLVIDHSVQVDHFGATDALDLNVDMEFSAIASATSSCAGARRRSTTSASCRRPSASCIR